TDRFTDQLPLTPLLFFMLLRLPQSTLFPYTTLFRSWSSSSSTTRSSVPPAVARTSAHVHWLRSQRAPSFPGPRDRSQWTCALVRSEEHTSELQSRFDLVCRLLLEKKYQPSVFLATCT